MHKAMKSNIQVCDLLHTMFSTFSKKQVTFLFSQITNRLHKMDKKGKLFCLFPVLNIEEKGAETE